MGLYKEKYTKEYFTGLSKEGDVLTYGVLGEKDASGNFILRLQDKIILEAIDFQAANVLEIGLGRGECARYVLEHGAARYIGVDFSEAAIDLAKENLRNVKGEYELICQDAVDFVHSEKVQQMPSIDVLLLFDVVEHIPRHELKIILEEIKKFLCVYCLVLVNTPAYKYDNDVVLEGLNELNNEGVDLSDTIPETAGMHCNKYTVESFKEFMQECGFYNLSKMHYFVVGDRIKAVSFGECAYKLRWEKAKLIGYKRLGKYCRDFVEYAYNQTEGDVQPVKFMSGNMQGIEVLLLDEYYKVAFPCGEYDSEMMQDFSELEQRKIVFDVGGFMGVSSLLFAKFSHDDSMIYCFEPNPWNRGRILDNFSLNDGYINKVRVVPLALGNMDGLVKMTLSTSLDNGYSSTSRIDNAHATIANDKLPAGFIEHSVCIVSLDSFVREHKIIPDVIKVDIEGAEHLFLRGAKEILAQYKPVLYIELHSEFCAVECMALLYEVGYAVEILHEDTDGRLLVKCVHNSNHIKNQAFSENLYSFSNIMNIAKKSNNILEYVEARLRFVEKSEYELQSLRNKCNELQGLRSKCNELSNLLEHIQKKKIYKVLAKCGFFDNC